MSADENNHTDLSSCDWAYHSLRCSLELTAIITFSLVPRLLWGGKSPRLCSVALHLPEASTGTVWCCCCSSYPDFSMSYIIIIFDPACFC